MFYKDCICIHKKFGPCKFVSEEGGKIIVEFFYSALRRERVEVKKNEIKRQILLEHTRVFVESGDFWKSGNVIMDYENDDGTKTYKVQFPNKEYQTIPEQEIYCRCWAEHDDPTVSLANGCMYTQFWHDRRQKFAETVIEQQSACRGLTSLLSSNIDILPPLSFGYLNIAIVLLVSSTSIFTANLGAKVSVNVNKITLRRIFSIFLLFTCLSLIIEHYII
mgnify:CR=1 FL=1